jgi:hypothetical protein
MRMGQKKLVMLRFKVNMLPGVHHKGFRKWSSKMGDTEQSTTSTGDISNQNGTLSQQNLSQQTTYVTTTGLKHCDACKSYKVYMHAYGASLCILAMIIPVIASLITIGVYLILPYSASQWYILLVGALIAVILWLVIAIPFVSFCTAQGANPHTYSLFKIRLHQLKINLGLKDYDDGSYDEIYSLDTVMQIRGFDKNNDKHKWEVVKEAYACCIELNRKLYKFPAGLQWYSSIGYTSAWRVLHHAEEVMIEVTDSGTVVREAKNDFRSLQGSKVSGKEKLLDDIIRAVTVLKPEALLYFKEYSPDKSIEIGRAHV